MKEALRRTRITATALIVLAAAAISWLVLVPRFEEPSRLSTTIDETNAQAVLLFRTSDAVDRREAYLKATGGEGNEGTKRYPPTADIAGLLNQITKAAQDSGMSQDQIVSITPGTATVVQKPTTQQAPQADTSGTSDTAATDEPSAAASSPAAAASASTPAKPSAANPVLALLPVEIQVNGSFDQLEKFLDSLGKMERAVRIDNVNLGVASGKNGTSYTLTVQAQSILMSAPPATPGSHS